MNIIITGGCGFIGSNFIRALIEYDDSDCKYINIDKLTYAGNINNLKDIEGDSRYTFIKDDICNPELGLEIELHGIDLDDTDWIVISQPRLMLTIALPRLRLL